MSARGPAVLGACLEAWRGARSAGFAGGYALDFLPLFASACLDRRDASLKEDWRAVLGAWLAEAPAPTGAA